MKGMGGLGEGAVVNERCDVSVVVGVFTVLLVNGSREDALGFRREMLPPLARVDATPGGWYRFLSRCTLL